MIMDEKCGLCTRTSTLHCLTCNHSLCIDCALRTHKESFCHSFVNINSREEVHSVTKQYDCEFGCSAGYETIQLVDVTGINYYFSIF